MTAKGNTPRRAVRVDDTTWHAALTIARERGDNLSDIIRQALNDYIKQYEGDK